MALVKCSECGSQVAKNAFSCPNCGAHDPSKSGARFLKGFFITIGIIFIALVAFLSMASANDLDSEAVIIAKQEITSEPTIKDLHYDPNAAVQWHIGVMDDGSQRHGFASYICDILLEHNLVSENTFVRIVDIVKVNQGIDFRNASLGRVNCTTYEQDFL